MSVQTRTNKMKNIKGPGLTTRIGLNHLLAKVSVKKTEERDSIEVEIHL